MELNFKIKDKSEKSLKLRKLIYQISKKKVFQTRNEEWKFTDLEKSF